MKIQAIKKYMKENKITYDELASRSGLSISTIKKIFSGISQYPRVDTMQAIENALGLSQSENYQELNSNPATVSDTDQKRLNILLRTENIFGKEYVDKLIELLNLQCQAAESKKS